MPLTLPVPGRLRRLRRAVLAHRRALAALLAALAVLVTVRAQAAPPPPTSTVLTAARDLPAGAMLRTADLARTPLDPAAVPHGALTSPAAAVGRTTTGAVRAGEPLTDVRLVTASVLRGRPDLAAVPVRIGDAAAVRLLRAGDLVDLVAADPQGREPAVTVASGVPVLAVPRVPAQSPGLTTGALVVVGLPDPSVHAVVQASVSSFISVVLRR